MNGILDVFEKIKEVFFKVCSFTEDVREAVEEKFNKLKSIFKTALGIEIGALIILVIGALKESEEIVFFSALGAVVIIIAAYLISAAIKDIILFGAKMIPPSKDKTIAEERKKGLDKVELNLIKFVNIINYSGMAIATIALWLLVFGFGSISWESVMIMTLVIIIFSCLGFFAKTEVVWPRKIVLALTIISTLSWFSGLDTEASRTLASWLNVIEIKTAESTDARNGAIAKVNATLYSIDQKTGNLSESSEKDTILTTSQFVRLTSKKGETRRIDDELFTKIVIPNELGSYARGSKYFIQSSFLERGVKFFPNANTPEYALKKKGKTWEVYFIKDMITLQDMPLGKRITVTGEGASWYNSKFKQYVPIVSGHRTDGRTIVTSTTIVFKKGGKLIIFFS